MAERAAEAKAQKCNGFCFIMYCIAYKKLVKTEGILKKIFRDAIRVRLSILTKILF